LLLHAAAGISGPDLSSSRSSFKAFVRMFPRIVLRFSGVARGGPGIVVVTKKISRAGPRSWRYRALLPPLQRIVLLVESRTGLRPPVCGSGDPDVRPRARHGLDPRLAHMAARADRAGMLQHLCHPDGRLHVIAAGHEGQLPDCAFLVAGILGRPDGRESRVDAAAQ